MAATKQVLRLQSDQTLDDPQVASQIRLKDLAATRAINLKWTEPAAADWDISFKDPTANDTVVYEDLAQPLNNKTLGTPTISDFSSSQHDHSNAAGGGPVDHSDIANPDATDDHAQYAKLGGRAGGQTLIGGVNAGADLTLQSTANVTRGQIAVVDDILMGTGKEVTGLPATPSGPTAAASKAYVDASVSGGASWRETLLTASQLDNTNDAIANAVAFYMANTAQNGDTFIINDGGSTETWTFAGASGAFQPDFGASALDSMTDLVSRINTDSAVWAAILGTALQGINPAGNVVIVYRQVPTAASTDRIYGVFTTPADAQHVDFGTELDYRSSISINLPGADPTSPNFGFGRITSGLTPNEAHLVRLEDSAYIWNEDAGVWQLSAGAVSLATSGSGGGVVGQSTYDSDKGLAVTAGVAEVRVDGSTITFTAGQLSVAGGAIPFGTSGAGGAVAGKVTADSDKGLLITGGPTDAILESKVDGVSIDFNPSGELKVIAGGIATGNVAHRIGLTRNITAVTPPAAITLGSDVDALSYPDGSTTGQRFEFCVPDDYFLGDLELLAVYSMSTAVAAPNNEIVLELDAEIAAVATGTISSIGVTTPTIVVANNSTNVVRQVIYTLTSGTFGVGDGITFKVKRLGADGADVHTGAWQTIAYEVRYPSVIDSRAAIQRIEFLSDALGETPPTAGTIGTDIDTLDYPDSSSTAQKISFLVPDNWDGASDALVSAVYAMSSSSAAVVRLETAGEVADVVGGSIGPVSAVTFDLSTTADTAVHRTVVRAVPAALLAPGNDIKLILRRLGADGADTHTGAFQLICVHVSFLVAPTAGFTTTLTTEDYLEQPVFDPISPSGINGDLEYPAFGTTFDTYVKMDSTTAAGRIDVAFPGRLQPGQTQIGQFRMNILGTGASPSYRLLVYADGSGASAVYDSTVLAAPLTETELIVTAGMFTGAQPTGQKRYHVVVEAHIDAGEAVNVSLPFVRQD